MVSTVRQVARDWRAEKKMSTFYISPCGVFDDVLKPITEIIQLDVKVVHANAIISKHLDEVIQFVLDEEQLFIFTLFQNIRQFIFNNVNKLNQQSVVTKAHGVDCETT